MQVGSSGSGGAMMLQLSQAMSASKRASVAQVLAVSDNLKSKRTNALQAAVRTQQVSAENKGKLLDIMA